MSSSRASRALFGRWRGFGGGGAVYELREARRRLVGVVGQKRPGGGADGVDVRQGARFRVAVHKLRRDVTRCPDGESYLRQAGVTGPVGYPKVRQLDHPVFVHQGVLGFDVPVDNTPAVGVDEGFQDLG